MLTLKDKFVFFIDDFLEPDQLVDIQKMINKVSFKETYNNTGLYAYRYVFSSDAEYELPHKEYIISKIESLGFASRETHIFNNIQLDTRENKEQPLIHKDDKSLNFLLYLYGEQTLTNGTGFWYENDGMETLSAHIGFVLNRAIIFNGDSIPHSDLQSFEGSSRRFSLTMFIDEK